MTLTCELVGDFSPIYVTTKQKADICDSFKLLCGLTNRCTHLYQMHHICMPVIWKMRLQTDTLSCKQYYLLCWRDSF